MGQCALENKAMSDIYNRKPWLLSNSDIQTNRDYCNQERELEAFLDSNTLLNSLKIRLLTPSEMKLRRGKIQGDVNEIVTKVMKEFYKIMWTQKKFLGTMHLKECKIMEDVTYVSLTQGPCTTIASKSEIPRCLRKGADVLGTSNEITYTINQVI